MRVGPNVGHTRGIQYDTDDRGRADQLQGNKGKNMQILWIHPPAQKVSSIWHVVW